MPDRRLYRTARREALSFSFWTDAVVYPLLAGAVGISWAMVGGIDAVSVSLGVSGILLGLSMWFWGYVRRRDQHAALILQERVSQLSRKRNHELECLEASLREDGMLKALEHVRGLRAGFASFTSVLERKFDRSELDYQRFRVALEELFLSTIDNSEHAVERLHAARNIDIDAVNDRIHHIETVGDDPNSMEIIELHRARTRFEALTSSAVELFEKNEAVLDTLRSSCEHLTEVETHRTRARGELDAILAEVSSLPSRLGLAGI